jgi:uncharacterized hydrophobic protein (TIGR00271 family)
MQKILPNENETLVPTNPTKGSLFRSLDEMYEDAYHNRQFTPVYLMMLLLAALIALLGLQLNSPAIIIGAMLISPLMWPILTCGLALNIADWPLGKKAARNVLLSVAEAIAITTIAALLLPLKEPTPEMLVRTNPNLLDLFVAFFSGAAGSLAWVSRARGGLTILPGVAIATAVMPPLAVTGFGIGTGQWEIAGGAFMLFTTNLMAIIISADLVFFLVGFRPQLHLPEKHRKFARYRFAAATLVLIILSIPLTHTLIRAAQQARMRSEINNTLRLRLEEHRARLGTVEFSATPARVVVDASVSTPRLIQMAQVRDLETELARRLGRRVELSLQQIRVEQNGVEPPPETPRDRDFVAGGAGRQSPRLVPEPPAAETLAQVQSRIQFLLGWLVQPLEVDAVTVNAIGRQFDQTILVDISARQLRPTTQDAWAVAAAALATELQAPVHVRGRVITRGGDNDIVRFPSGAAALPAAELRRVREFAGQWAGRPDLRLAFAPSAQAPPPLTTQRLTALRTRFDGADAAEPMLAYDLPPEEVRFYLAQQVDAVGQPTPLAPGGEPPPAPAAASPAPER